MATPTVVKIDKGSAKLYASNGAFIRTISGNSSEPFISGNINSDEVYLTTSKGKVKIYGINGAYKRTI